MCVCVRFALLILPRTFIWQHHDTPRTLHLPRTQKRVLGKHWLKTPKTSCFTILGGSALRGPQWTSNLTCIYEDIRVLGNISKASRGVCVWGGVGVGGCVCVWGGVCGCVWVCVCVCVIPMTLDVIRTSTARVMVCVSYQCVLKLIGFEALNTNRGRCDNLH